MKNTIKHYILAFLIPFLICLLVSYCKLFIFGGPKNLLISDMHGQYISLFTYLYDVMTGQESLFYSFSKGLGGNMLGTFAYYLASPLNFLLVLFSKIHLTWGLLLILIIKISLSGLIMYIYLNKTFINKDKIFLLMFSTSYALIAYNVNYYFNIMWLDAVYLAPLILLGIDNIIKNKSSILYGITLFLAILINYYTGYMLCIMSCIYFIYRIFVNFKLKEEKEKIIIAIIKFSITSILAGLMSFILLIPVIMELQNTQRAFGDAFSKKIILNFNIFDVLSRTYIGSHNNENIISPNTAAIYSGLIILPLIYFYFINKKFKLKEKIADGILLSLLLLSIIVPYLNIIWHGFSFPNGFNYRFSFIVSLFMIIIACKSFWQIKNISLKHYMYFYVGYLIISIIIIILNYQYLSNINIFISIACMGLYLILFYSYGKEIDIKRKNLIKYLIIFMVLSELFFNFFISIRNYKVGYQNEYEGHITTMRSKIDEYEAKEKEFYRIDKNISFSLIDSMLLNYNSVTLFLSTVDKELINFFNNAGSNVRQVCIDYQDGTTPIMDSILGLKYYFVSIFDKSYYELVDKFEFSKYTGLLYGMKQTDIKIYENPYALSLGYMVSDKVKDFTKIFIDNKEYNNFEYQNTILQTMVNTDYKYLKSYNIDKINESTYSIDINNDSDFYFMVPFINNGINDAKVNFYLNNEFIKSYSDSNSGIFFVKNKYSNEKVKLNIEIIDGEIILGYPVAYYVDYDLFESAIYNLKSNQLVIEKQDKNYIKGMVNVPKDKKLLFTSIPYEKGWTVKVDGNEMKYYKVYDAFIGLNLEEGWHDIEFSFYPPGLTIGILITLISGFIFLLYIWKETKILKFLIKFYNRYEKITSYLIIGGLTTVVNFIIYLIFTKLFGIDYIISLVIAWIFAVLFAYVTNKIFVFRSKTNDIRAFYKETYRFFKYRIISLAIDISIMFVMVDMIFINDVLAKLFAQFVVVILNYVFSKKYIFRE